MHVVPGFPDEVFVGRAPERDELSSLIGGVRAGGGAVVVAGEAGAGKTALLRHVVRHAPGRVTSVHGVESEAVLPFATAADLLLPLREHLAQLPDVQREALEISLALRPGPAGSPLAVCAAALALLSAAAEQEPLVLVVDDLQWVDAPSRQVLSFVARRLGPERVVIVFGLRMDPVPELVPAGLPVLVLGGLSADEIRQLATGLGVEVSAEVLHRLVAETGGNPLAVTETLSATPAATLRGTGADFEGPHVGPVLRRAWSAAIDDLDERSALVLAVLAAGHADVSTDLAPVVEALGCSPADLVPAERRGLVLTRRHHVELRHPLLRTVVLDRTPLADRLRVYRALAENTRGHHRAWYLAAASTPPDRQVRDALALAAGHASGRGAHQSAAGAWARAADFTTDPADGADLRLRAATEAQLAGDAAGTRRWCDLALELRSDPLFAADVEAVRARSTTWSGRPGQAADDLVSAAEDVLAHDGTRAARLYAEATLPCAMTARIDDMLDNAERGENAAGASPTLQTAAAVAAAFALGGRPERSRRMLDVAESLLRTGSGKPDLHTATYLAQARLFLEDHVRSAELLTVARREARRLGSPAALAVTLCTSADLHWWTGDWVVAYADGDEGLRWAEEMGQASAVGYALTSLGRIDAARGDEARCRSRMERCAREIGPHGLHCLDVYVPAVLGALSLAGGHTEPAQQHLDAAWSAARRTGLTSPTVVPFAGDLIEAHVRAGDRDGAREAVDWVESSARATGLPHPAVVAARGRGMLATDPARSAAHFAHARRLHEHRPSPFERARTLLCEGESLRRWRRPALARRPLQDALAVFERLGARPWAARAELELHASGAPRPKGSDDAPALDRLSPQEFQTARAVASGLNNVEAAAALFISRKTVEAHLSRVYRKLGVRSRADLVRVLGNGAAAP